MDKSENYKKDKRYFNYKNIIDLIFKRDFCIFRGHNQINLNKYQLDKVSTYIPYSRKQKHVSVSDTPCY